jgi:gamma-glutamylaminecyclotransferase
MDKLLVYGRLKRGYSNHRRLGQSKFIGAALSVDATYAMHTVAFGSLYERADGYKVRGQLYEVDADALSSCDRLEQHPNLYVRQRRKFAVGDDIYEAWVYLMPTSRFTPGYDKPPGADGVLEWKAIWTSKDEAQSEWNALAPEQRHELFCYWKASGAEHVERKAQETWFAGHYDDFDRTDPAWIAKVDESTRESLAWDWMRMDYRDRLLQRPEQP